MLDGLFTDEFWCKNSGILRIYIAEMFSAIHLILQHFQAKKCDSNYLI